MADGLFWWHLGIAMQLVVVAVVIVGLALFVRWGRRRSTSRESSDRAS